jgi:hypothetical protein
VRTDLPATWFRLYAEFATDPKVQMLSEIDQRRFIVVMCLRCCNGSVTLQDTEVAFQLRISDEEWANTKRVLLSKNLIGDDNKPIAWEKRQFDSDTSNARVYKHREKKKLLCNVTVAAMKRKSNAPETETETETEKKKKTVDGLDPVAWSRWLDYRTSIRKPIKPVSIPAAQRKLAGFGTMQAEVVEQSVANGWTGMFELKTGDGYGKNGSSRGFGSSVANTIRELTGQNHADARTIDSDATRLD